MIPAEALAQTVRRALDEGWGYIWGTSGQLWTAADQRAATETAAARYGARWIGHRVADCSGLIRWAFRALGGDIYHGSDTMFRRYTVENGPLRQGRRADGRELPAGAAVFIYSAASGKYEHVGLYAGGGQVIEAKGTRSGVVASPVTARWTHWGLLKGVDYGAARKEEDMDNTYLVTAESGSWVRLRSEPSTEGRDLAHVPLGSLLQGGPAENGWAEVRWQGERGFMQAKFLRPAEGVTLTLTAEEAALLLALAARLKAVMA